MRRIAARARLPQTDRGSELKALLPQPQSASERRARPHHRPEVRGQGPCRDNAQLTPPRRQPLNATTSEPRLLAFDTSTDQMSVGVRRGERYWLHSGPGAAQSSATLIPTVLDLLAQADLSLHALDAIVFGRGPGSFTGLRTACAVAQGLAAGSQRLVLPVDTLMAVAEEARIEVMRGEAASAGATHISALLDARMDEVYLQHFEWTGAGLQAIGPCELCAPEAVRFPPAAHRLVAGNALEVYRERLGELPAGSRWIAALPTASALLRLAPRLLHQAVAPAQALPLYVRDKVAQTTEERSAAKVAKAEAAELAAHRRPAP